VTSREKITAQEKERERESVRVLLRLPFLSFGKADVARCT
jgi:hypothetical protein